MRRLILLGVLAGFAPRAAAAAPVRIGVLPPTVVNLRKDQGARYLRLLSMTLRDTPLLELADPAVRDRLAKLPTGCTRDPACLRRVRRLGIQRLVGLRVGRLGKTTLIKLTAYDLTRGARLGTWQEMLTNPDYHRTLAAFSRMVAGFAPAPPSPKPWYRRWWVWTAAGAVVAAAVTTAVVLTRGDEGPARPDIEINPPAL